MRQIMEDIRGYKPMRQIISTNKIIICKCLFRIFTVDAFTFMYRRETTSKFSQERFIYIIAYVYHETDKIL